MERNIVLDSKKRAKTKKEIIYDQKWYTYAFNEYF